MIEPFSINIPQADLDDLTYRLARTRWPSETPSPAYGLPLADTQRLTAHWLNSYDWRKHEAEINSHPQFTTVIDGQRIHFLHIRCANPDALPIVLTHGWPGSIVEFLDVIGPLSEDFHLVIPSLPGFGYSVPVQNGWDVDRIARAWAELMHRLGYDRYGAQGGDWGAAVSRALAHVAPDNVVAVHLSYLPTPPVPGVELNEEDARRMERVKSYLADQPASRALNAKDPQTVAYALSDSPVGQLAWIADRFADWGDPDTCVPVDRLLTNVMLYWLTSTAGSAARLYRETKQNTWLCEQPVGVAVYAHDITQSIRVLAEKSFTITQWSEYDNGGHYPALEVPDVFARDVRNFFLPFGRPA